MTEQTRLTADQRRRHGILTPPPYVPPLRTPDADLAAAIRDTGGCYAALNELAALVDRSPRVLLAEWHKLRVGCV